MNIVISHRLKQVSFDHDGSSINIKESEYSCPTMLTILSAKVKVRPAKMAHKVAHQHRIK